MSEEKKNEILNEKLDTEELNAVSGGKPPCDDGLSDEDLKILTAERKGNCSGLFYAEKCRATVENGSWCRSNDKCIHFDVKYTGKQ